MYYVKKKNNIDRNKLKLKRLLGHLNIIKYFTPFKFKSDMFRDS